MEFLKHNWGYLLLIAVVLITAAVVWYLLFLAGNRNPYAGGLLVRAVLELKEMLA
ncbi:MAG: hypothetical protein HFG65_01370 [Hungatella sp.]|nr:hypothetical protein [Hungatella sp.]